MVVRVGPSTVMIGDQAGSRPRQGVGGSPAVFGVDAAFFRSGRCACLVVLTGALIWLAGCATPARVAVLEPIGPAQTRRPEKGVDGFLQVYSARKPATVDPYMAERLWNNDFGKNEFLYEPAHTDYTIYSQDGRPLRQVRNARSENDPEPTRVSLPPGHYEIQAEAEDDAGLLEVRVPVVIQAGRTTTAHLAGGWKPHRHYTDHDVVRLPDGEIAGWLATR